MSTTNFDTICLAARRKTHTYDWRITETAEAETPSSERDLPGVVGSCSLIVRKGIKMISGSILSEVSSVIAWGLESL